MYIWISRAVVFFLILAFGIYQRKTEAFAGAGPFTHISITMLALQRYADETGYEMSPFCQETLLQASVTSDGEGTADNAPYHCDGNDLAACSHLLSTFKEQVQNSYLIPDSLWAMGKSFHIVQDFYSHSNWVETFGFSMVLAPIESFKVIPPPANIQTGFYPDYATDNPMSALACFTTPPSAWNQKIPGATHACLHKDSNFSLRGSTLVEGSIMTYHELAAEYAIRHTLKMLRNYDDVTPQLSLCYTPMVLSRGCAGGFSESIH